MPRCGLPRCQPLSPDQVVAATVQHLLSVSFISLLHAPVAESELESHNEWSLNPPASVALASWLSPDDSALLAASFGIKLVRSSSDRLLLSRTSV